MFKFLKRIFGKMNIPIIKSMSFDDLNKKIGRLKRELSNFDMVDICGNAYTTILKIDWSKPNQTGMTSPYKQCSYIISLALATPQSAKPKRLTKNKWKVITKLSEEIFSYYSRMYFPDDGNFSKISEETHKKVSAAMPAFLLSLGADIGASVEQVKDDIKKLYLPFDKEITGALKISVNQLLDMASYVIEILEKRIENGPQKIVEAWLELRELQDAGVDATEIMERIKSKLKTEHALNFMRMNQVLKSDLLENFSEEDVEQFIFLFSQERATKDQDFLYPTEPHLIRMRPMVKVDENAFFVTTGNQLVIGILEKIAEFLKTDDRLYERYNEHKANLLEQQSLDYLKAIFGKAKFYEEVYETPTAHNEHDIVIQYGKNILIIECKAKGIRKSFRDPEGAYKRISSDFKEYIQEGCDQAFNLKKLILSQDKTPLYDSKGKVIFTVDRSQIDNIECICITKDNEGLLAANLSLLFTKNENEEYPYCINSYDLRQLAEYKDDFGITPEIFLSFLKERRQLHGKVANDDEFDYWEYYIREGSFGEYLTMENVIISLPPSSMIDKAYLARNAKT